MRVFLFIGYMSFFFLGGGYNFYANKHQMGVDYSTIQKLSENHHLKYTNKDQSTTLIEDNDSDVEEEYVRIDEVKEGSENTLLMSKYSLPDSWYSSFKSSSLLKHYIKSSETSLLHNGNKSPIYIKNCVYII